MVETKKGGREDHRNLFEKSQSHCPSLPSYNRKPDPSPNATATKERRHYKLNYDDSAETPQRPRMAPFAAGGISRESSFREERKIPPCRRGL